MRHLRPRKRKNNIKITLDRRFLRHFAQYVTLSHLLSQQFQLLHSATFHAASLLRAATLHTVPLFRAATRQSASTQTVTFSHDKRCNQKSQVRDSATTSVTSGSLHHLHTATASRHDGYPLAPQYPPRESYTLPTALRPERTQRFTIDSHLRPLNV